MVAQPAVGGIGLVNMDSFECHGAKLAILNEK
jgi:hypothetical protein